MTKDEIKAAPIGLPVMVADTLLRDAKGTKRQWITYRQWIWPPYYKPKPKYGFLTGFASLANGDCQWYEDHCEWTQQGEKIFVARVKFTPGGREHYADPEDVTVIESVPDKLGGSDEG